VVSFFSGMVGFRWLWMRAGDERWGLSEGGENGILGERRRERYRFGAGLVERVPGLMVTAWG